MTNETVAALFAALQAMVHDIHAPQDNLTPEDWDEATLLCDAFTAEADRRRADQCD